jgi:phospholipid transport system transporter-binding protein
VNASAAAAGFELAGAGGAFSLAGVLSFETATAVLRSGEAAFAGTGARSVDLSGVTHADSAGLSVLLTWVEEARREGRTLHYISLPAQLVRIARLCAVEQLLAAAESPAPAASA